MAHHPNDTLLAIGQRLIEQWDIEFEGRERRHEKPYRYVTARLANWYNGTYYAVGSEGETIGEARLALILGTARAICDDPSAFSYDAEQIYRAQMLRWFQGKLKELDEELELECGEMTPGAIKKLRRRINFIEQLTAEWQEDHDYWPEEKDATASQATRQADRSLIKRHLSTECDKQRAASTGPAGDGQG